MTIDTAPMAGAASPHVAVKRQRIVGTRRRYNQWVADETLEDYALRFTAERGRTWSPSRVGHAALGSIAFLACEAIGASLTLGYGSASLVWAMALAAPIFLIAGLAVCYYGARYGMDMDLLTRGAGFGYLGSTITSAFYASFTFILFAVEALILSAALQLCFAIPLPIGHLLSALVVIPIAAYGFRRIAKWQAWTQPAWLLLQAAPLLFLATQGAPALELWRAHDVAGGAGWGNVALALAVLLALLPQIAEQVDYLRFLPDQSRIGARRWWTTMLLTGPGWIVVAGAKILIGSFLAVLALSAGMSTADAANPTALYFMTFSGLIASPAGAIVLTGLFVALCQIKINVTNAYAGSIASSNFFARLTHRHPGRVVWLVFNTLIALILMQAGIQTVIERVLAVYSLFAVAWFGAVVGDLAVNKPLGLSPKSIEFRRAYLHDLNPVGIGAMLGSLACSGLCLAGLLGAGPQKLASPIGLAVAFVLAPAIAWATGGRYYLARPVDRVEAEACRCIVCENRFEPPDMAWCPVYAGAICSLCCTLEARCGDACKQRLPAIERIAAALRRLVPSAATDALYVRVVRFAVVYAGTAGMVAGLLLLIFYQREGAGEDPRAMSAVLASVFVGLLPAVGFFVWFFVLGRESQRAAEDESERQTAMLMAEIAAHARTDAELQRAKNAAEAANFAKSRYIVGISHEIRTPLNAISGYAQLLERQPGTPVGDAVRVIRRSAAHLTDLVDGLIDVSRIENGSLTIARERVNLIELIDQIVDMFRIQAAARGIAFEHTRPANLPVHVFTDHKRLRQILINLISNAIKYTPAGSAALHVHWRSSVAEFVVQDSGVGIAQDQLERIFAPFERLETVRGQPGVGLGLTITRMLVQIMGGELTVDSRPGGGSSFRVKLYLSATGPDVAEGKGDDLAAQVEGRRVLIVDDDSAHLELLRALLMPLRLDLAFCSTGEEAIAAFPSHRPDLVIMDVAMPGLGGWEAARRLRAENGEGPAILMVSANVHDGQRPRAADDPHDDFLAKPYEVEVLLDRVGTLLALQPASSAER